MNSKITSILFVLAFFIFAVPFSWSASDKKVSELYKKTGAEKQIGLIAESVKIGFNQTAKTIPADKKQAIMSVIDSAYAESILKPPMIEKLTSQLSDEEAEKILEWLNSPVGQKITASEEEASKPEAVAAMQEFYQNMATNPPDPEKASAVNRVISAAQLVEFSAIFAMNTQKAIMFAMASPLDMANPRFEQTMKQIDESKEIVKKQIGPQVLASLLYSYKDLSIDEIKQYAAFLETDIGKKYTNVMIEGSQEGYKAAGEHLGRGMAEALK